MQSNMGFGMCLAKSATQTPQQALDELPQVHFYFQAGSGPGGGAGGNGKCHTSSGATSVTPARTWFKTNATNSGGASAICLLTAAALFRSLGQNVPVGAVESCYGQTDITSWSPPAGNNWKDYMVPLLPMVFKAALWDQGEADAAHTNSTFYAAAFPEMIHGWRAAFRTPRLPFVYVGERPWQTQYPTSNR